MDLTDIVNTVIKSPYLPYMLIGVWGVGVFIYGLYIRKDSNKIENQYSKLLIKDSISASH